MDLLISQLSILIREGKRARDRVRETEREREIHSLFPLSIFCSITESGGRVLMSGRCCSCANELSGIRNWPLGFPWEKKKKKEAKAGLETRESVEAFLLLQMPRTAVSEAPI